MGRPARGTESGAFYSGDDLRALAAYAAAPVCTDLTLRRTSPICGTWKMITATYESVAQSSELPSFAAMWNVRTPAYGVAPWGR